jgi:excisionase family DNA binding protein
MERSNTEQWVNIRQAAEHLGLSVAFLRKAVRQKRVPYARAGSKALRFRKAELDAWMEQHSCDGKLPTANTKAAECVNT